MAADLHIHVLEGITENDLQIFNSNTFGSKYFDLSRMQPSSEEWDKVYDKISDAPNIWIGEVSWLKAALCDDAEQFVPDSVAMIHELIGEDLPVLNDELIAKILKAMGLKNETSYGIEDGEDDIQKFLQKHKGKKVFTVSW